MNQEFINKLDILISQWIKQVQVNPGIADDIIQKLESDIGFCFEEKFRYYLTKINGFKDLDSDESWFSFWSHTRIKDENGTHPKEVIWFADHSLSLCCFGFHKTDKKIYTHFDKQDEIILIANSFNEFIDIYLDNPYRLVL